MTQSTRNSNPFDSQYESDPCHDLMQNVCESSSDAIVIYDYTGRIVSMNRTAETLFGYAIYDVVEQPINLLLPTIDWQPSDNQYLTQMTTGQTQDKQSFHAEVMVTDFRDGYRQYYLTVIRDMSSDMTDNHVDLSPRQRQILKLVVRGYTSREIAEKLTISIKTVETHRANIMTKLGVRNVSSLVRHAIRNNII